MNIERHKNRNRLFTARCYAKRGYWNYDRTSQKRTKLRRKQ